LFVGRSGDPLESGLWHSPAFVTDDDEERVLTSKIAKTLQIRRRALIGVICAMGRHSAHLRGGDIELNLSKYRVFLAWARLGHKMAPV